MSQVKEYTTAHQLNVFLTGIHRLVVTKESLLSPAQTTAKVKCKLLSQ